LDELPSEFKMWMEIQSEYGIITLSWILIDMK